MKKPEKLKPGEWWCEVVTVFGGTGWPDEAEWGAVINPIDDPLWRLPTTVAMEAATRWFDETGQSSPCAIRLRIECAEYGEFEVDAGLRIKIVPEVTKIMPVSGGAA